ncbi:MAG: hypothetical protein NTZ78_01260 [Candidatus Aureabacteria bacterium]|nr:hypothetical protein [Candidatus Auribacterota bacterium]
MNDTIFPKMLNSYNGGAHLNIVPLMKLTTKRPGLYSTFFHAYISESSTSVGGRESTVRRRYHVTPHTPTPSA